MSELLHHQLLGDALRPKIFKLAERRKLVDECFKEFQRMVYPGAPQDQVAALRIAFFAGAAELLAMQMYGTQPGLAVTGKDIEFMYGVTEEVEAFHQRTIDTMQADTKNAQ
ncbi:hypothetical protein K1W69_17295 [Hoeflea sp. WL0058]|uniref:Uncharacterized protein n=1 Tax=Flavimaribacter sediminis TaxID=2865987 RepID=A0AAE2ZQL8_9HYPH|nr:hypothetical protein [Flavimaribacter sediminis]MBW8638955.1 hypothetical protein [Flavimaribacter sediminis]